MTTIERYTDTISVFNCPVFTGLGQVLPIEKYPVALSAFTGAQSVINNSSTATVLAFASCDGSGPPIATISPGQKLCLMSPANSFRAI
jgi:hypothetical protein